ncbi:MAG: hypothetical protein DMF82_04950 [Acidobacteria bacterium]|nr:MAG: hypothetical protein DMF82_04950 [Acidobacteriota bacterium]
MATALSSASSDVVSGRLRQLHPALGVGTVEHRRPTRAPSLGGLDHPRKEALPQRQRPGEAQRHRPEREVLRNHEPRRERVAADGRAEKKHGLGRRQREGRDGPGHELGARRA